jgi:hypothetical protein
MYKKDQETLYKEWINTRDHTNAGLAQGYGLRIGPDKKRLVFCRNSFMNLLNLGRFRWSTLNTTKLVLGYNTHKNVENTNASASQETVDSVLFYLYGIAKQFGESYAMRFVSTLTKFKIRDEERDIIDLPSCITKHSLFEKWCFSRGWIATTDNAGCYRFEARNTEENFWEDCETQEVCSWWKFLELWRVHLPHVCIRAPCYDTCG